MFSNIKTKIKQLAKDAVFIAEQKLGTGKGQEKKKKWQLIILLIVFLFPATVKSLIALLLSSFY